MENLREYASINLKCMDKNKQLEKTFPEGYESQYWEVNNKILSVFWNGSHTENCQREKKNEKEKITKFAKEKLVVNRKEE